jgi:hypothetical protein
MRFFPAFLLAPAILTHAQRITSPPAAPGAPSPAVAMYIKVPAGRILLKDVFKDGVGYDSQKLLKSALGRYGQY